MNAGINAQQSGRIFDAAGAVHYTHADYQGSIIAVTDSAGVVVQTTNYYPYGEPWREPTGQPMLFAGKERTTNSDYIFGPRHLMSDALLWTAPDQLAGQFRHLSPYSYCAGNPVLYTDPTGKRIYLDKDLDLNQLFNILLNLQELTDDHIVFQTQKDGSRMVKIDELGSGTKIYGTGLIRYLNSSSARVEIGTNKESSNGKGNADENWVESIIPNGEEVSCLVNFVPGYNPKLAVYDRKTGLAKISKNRPDYIGLAHELIHCMHHIDGSYKEGKMFHPKVPGKYSARIDEYETIGISGNRTITENSIRKEHGLEERAMY